MRAPSWAFVWVVILVGASSRSASAGTIVLESHVEARASSTEDVLAPLFDELANRQVERNYQAVGQRFEVRSSSPAVVAPGLPSDFVEQVEKGYQHWVRGQFQPAVSVLQPLVDAAHRNASVVVASARVSAAVFKALVAISLCYRRLGDELASSAAMLELLRSFDAEVSKGQFGLEANELFRRVRDESRDQGSAALVVRSSEDSAVLFLNERFLKVGEATRTDLIPGRYRILAQLGKRPPRVHFVELEAGDSVRLEVDPLFESSVVTSAEWSGFVFRDRIEREQREVALAARFGTVVEALSVILVGVDIEKGRSVVYGALVDPTTGKEVRRGSVELGTFTPSERLRALARFLTGAKPEEGVKVYTRADAVLVKPIASRAMARDAIQGHPGGSSSPWKWIATGGAVAGLGAGVTLLFLDGTCASDPPAKVKCPDFRDLRVGGYVTLGAGIALGGVATWLWLRERSSKRSDAAVWIAPARGGGIAGLSLPLW